MEGNNVGMARNKGERVTGTIFSGSGSYGGDMGVKQKSTVSKPDYATKELDLGDSPNVYLGQCDAIKEKMAWGVMGREKAMTAGFLEVGRGSNVAHVERVSAGRAKSNSLPCKRRLGGKNLAHELSEPRSTPLPGHGTSKVGGKKRGGAAADGVGCLVGDHNNQQL